MMKITYTDSNIQARFNQISVNIRNELAKSINALTLELETYIKEQKLMGQVLNRITGNLGRSIHSIPVVQSETDIVGKVIQSSDVAYGRIHEYGGRVRTRLGTGLGKPKVGGLAYATMPERSFMRSSLMDFRSKIVAELQAATKRGCNE